MDKNLKKTIIISILVLLGFLVTIDLAYIYYEANFDQYALPSFCSVSELIDCDGVARTVESQFLGIPLAYWGMFLYSFMIMLLGVDLLKKIPGFKFLEVFKNKFHYIASLGLISFTISMILLCVSLFSIHKICVMCAVTYVIDLCIAIFAVEGIEGNFVGAIKQSWFDFVDALKPLPYRVAFVIVIALACGFLGWTYTSAKFSPALKVKRNYGEFINAKTNKYAVKGNTLGKEEANDSEKSETKKDEIVVINIYSDYMCPMCTVFNMMIHKAAGEFENIRIEHHSMPLDKECNKYMEQEFHHGSCTMARYAEAAHMQGKFWEVNSLFFDKKPATEQEVINVLESAKLGLDMNKLKKDAASKEVMDIINKDIDYAVSHKQFGTPTMQIGDYFEMGVPKGGYPALKELIIEHGGKTKKLFDK